MKENLVLSIIEAFIFAQPKPVTEKALIALLQQHHLIEADNDENQLYIHHCLTSLQNHYANRGIVLCQIANGWQFRTASDIASYITQTINRPKRLTRSAMETLAIIAYHQPCTRADIEQIRGVSLTQTVTDHLLEMGLITPKGHKKVPGRPTLWGTTPAFLEYLGINDLCDLPKREELLGDIPYQDNPL